MAKYLQLPNGDSLKVPATMSYEEAMAAAQRKFPELFSEAPKKGGSGLGDLARSFASSALGATGALTSAFGADNVASQGLSEASDSLQEGLSAKRQAQLQRQAERMQKAEESGSMLQEAKAGALNILEAPLISAAQAVGSFVPMLLTLPLGPLGLGARAVMAARGAIGAAQGAGAVKQSVYEAVLRAEEEDGKSPEKAQAAAVRAQNYIGANLDQILLGTVVGGVAGGTGAERLFPGGVRAQASAAQQALAKRVGERTATGVTTALAEMPLEGFQEGQERVAANLALQRTGRDVETFTGAAGSATQGALLGGLGGGALGAALPDRSVSRAAAEARRVKLAETTAAAEQERLAQEQTAAAEEAAKKTPEYALGVANQLTALEQEKIGLRQQIRKISKESATEAEDKAFNKEINAKLAINAAARSELGPEVNRLKQAGIYDQALEQERVKGLSPEEYMLERTGTVRNRKVASVEDTAYEDSGLAFKDPLVPGVERRKAADAEKARVAAIPAAYAAERFQIAQDQRYDPTGQEYVEYLLQDPYKAQLVVETRTPMPGLSSSESTLIRNELAKRLKAMGKDELAARQAELQAQTVGKTPADPMAAFMEQSDALDVDRRQGVTDSDIAFTERQAAMPTQTVTQGELFGGAQQRVNMPQVGTPADINAQIKELERQLDVAKSFGAPDSATRPGDREGRRANRERVSTLMEQIKDLKDRQAKIAAGAPMGGDTDAVRAYIAAGTPDRAPDQTIEDWYSSLPENAGIKGPVSALPEQEKAQREAADARTAAAQDVILNRQQDRRPAVIDNLLKEIQLVRGRLKPETITQITNDVDAILNKPKDSDAALRALDDLSNRYRAGIRRDTFGATEATPRQTSEDMLRTQMDRVFAQNDQSTRTERRERYAPADMALLNQIADNFKAFTASPERRNMAGELVNRMATTGRSSPEMARDVRAELAKLERAKISETEKGRTAVQQELGADLMPEAVAPQSETRVVNGKVQYVSPEDKGPLQGSAAERYAPMQKGTIFATPEELDAYLSSDYLKEARENQGLARDTVSRLRKQVAEYETKIGDTQKQIDALQERKAELQTLQVPERRAADNIVADTEVQLEELLKQMADDLGPIRMALEQAEMNLAAAEARSEETSRLIANKIVNFTAMDDKVVRAAQDTAAAKADLRKARNKLGSLDEKRPGIEEAQRKVIAALQRQRNPVLYEMQEQLQKLQKQQSLARVTQPRTVERLQKEIAELEDQMDVQRDNPYVPSSAMITFLNNDLQLQMDAMQDRATIGAAKRSVLYFKNKLDKAASDLKVDISTHPEVKALREQISVGKELGTDALRGVEKELALLDDKIEKAQLSQQAIRRQAGNVEDQIIAAGEERTFAGQLAGTTPDTVSALDRAETLANNKKKLEEFQDRTQRLAALPGQRVDFSKRQEMFQMVKAATEDFAQLDTDIEALRKGVEELQVRDHFMHEEMLDLQDQAKSFRGPRKNSKAGKEHFAKMEKHKKKMEENTKRIQSLRDSITQYEKTRVTKQAALAKAEVAMSSDPEVYQTITKSIDARMAKLDKTVAGKQAAAVKGDATILEMARDIKAKADEGKTTPENLAQMRKRLKTLRASQADRNKHLKEYIKERDVLKARRSNRLGITRTSANMDALKEELATAEARLRTVTSTINSKSATKQEKAVARVEAATLTEAVEDLRKRTATKPTKATLTEQEQMDAEIGRVQELARAKERKAELEKGMAALQKAKEPKTEVKKIERADRVANLQAAINKQQALIDSLTPQAAGAVSQATKIESSAPGKFRTGTAESKAEKGTVRRPITETRTVVQPTAEKAVADANAFATRINAAKTNAQRAKLLREQDEVTQVEIEDALLNNVEYLKNRVASLEKEREQLKGAKGTIAVDRLADITIELEGARNPQGDVLTKTIYDNLKLAEKQLADYEAAIAKAESAEIAEADARQDADRAEYGARITELGAFEGGTDIDGFDIGVSDTTGDFDFDSRYRVSKTTGPSMSVAQVQKVYDALTGDWANKPQTIVVADEKGLPVRIRNQAERDNMTGKIPGLYDPVSGKMYLVASNLRSANDVVLTTVHEIAGHFGLQKVLGNTYNQTMNDIYSGNVAIRKAADAKMKQIKSLKKETAVEEALAEQAELDPNAPDTRSAMRKIYDAMKKWMRDTFGFKDTVTDAQVNQIIANARRFVIEGGEAGKGAAGLTTPSYRSTQAEPDGAIEALSRKLIAQPKTIKERLGNNLALQVEMSAVDGKAGLREALRFGDDKLFTEAMHHVRRAEQKMPLMYTVFSNGPLVTYKDSKGLTGYRSSNENSGASVLDAIADIPRDNPQMKSAAAQMYLVAIRANNKGLPKLDLGALKVEQAELDAVLAEANADPALKAALENVRRKYNAYNRGQIEFVASTGRITKKVAADLLKEGDFVPFYRVDKNGSADLVFNNNVTFNVGDIRRQPYLAELKGGETKLLPLNEAIQRNTLLLTDMALTNNATKSVAYGLQALGKGMGPIDPKTGKATDRMPIQKGTGPDSASTMRFFQEPDPSDPKDKGERHLIVDTVGTLAEGIPTAMVVQSLEGASLTLPGFLKLGGIAADFLRAGVTRSPLYIARKLIREPMAAAFTGGLNQNTFSAILSAGTEYVRMSRGTSEMQAKLLEKGLIRSDIFAGDMSDIEKMSLQFASGKDQSALHKVLAAADRYAMRADAATLALVLRSAEANGLSEVEADLMTIESMNLYKRGLTPTIQYAARLIPFFSAQIQGLNVLIKAARGNMPFEEQQQIKRKFFNNALLLMGTGLVYAMAMEDDETFRNARPRDKYSNFFLPIPFVEEPVKLPIPFEAGYFFSLAVAAVDAMRAETDGKAQFQALRDLFLSSIPGYSSMGIPTLVKPALEVWTDKNFLTGGPVEPRRLQGVDIEERYLDTTTELAKQMSKALPLLSPIQIEHIVRGHLGVLPLAAAAAANNLFATTDKGEKADRRASELPLIGTGFQKKFGGGDADVVFREAQEAIDTRNTLNKMINEGRREDAVAYREKHRVELTMATAAGQYRQVVGRINADIRRTKERKDLTAEEKRLRLDMLDKAKQDRADAFIRQSRLVEERVGAGKT